MAPCWEHLPYVDEHAIAVAAEAEATWEALLRTVDTMGAPRLAVRFAALLGCEDREAAGPRPLREGSATVGFHVAAAVPGAELALAGRHRFSDYALVFRLDRLGERETRLRAETRAEFPGLSGSAYRALVIGSRGHVVATRRILNAVKRRAERA
jgi:hypothetical protein